MLRPVSALLATALILSGMGELAAVAPRPGGSPSGERFSERWETGNDRGGSSARPPRGRSWHPVLCQGPGEEDGRVFLTRDQAFREIFPDLDRVRVDEWRLDAADAEAVEAESGVAVERTCVLTYRVFGPDGALRGYAMVLDERGKYRPITFMVGVTTDLEVRGVEVMVYREDRGDEVRHDRFLRQYRGKERKDPIRTHRDIVNVTGATISVRSLNRGVKRALTTLGLVYGGDGGPGPRESRVLSVDGTGSS